MSVEVPYIFSVKGFSTRSLTATDVKKKKKKKQKTNKPLETQHQNYLSDTESVVDNDILKFASSISNRLKEIDEEEVDGSDYSPKLSPSDCLHKTSNISSNEVKYDMINAECKENSTMGKISPQKKKKDHQMSDSDADTTGILNIKREITPSPVKSPAKKAQHKKKKDHLMSDSDADTTGILNIKREITPSPVKSPAKKAKHKKKSPIKNIAVGDERTKDNDSSMSDDSTPVQLRYKPEDDFVMIESSSTESQLCAEDMKGKDLWLIKAPLDFDVKNLSNKTVCLNGLQSLSTESEVKQFEVHAFEDSSLSASSLQPVVPYRRKRAYTTGPKFKGQMHIIQSIQVPPLPEIVVPKPVKHKIPSDLKPRFEPFGSTSPEKNYISTTGKQKRHTDIQEDIETPSKSKKKKKKHKHHRT